MVTEIIVKSALGQLIKFLKNYQREKTQARGLIIDKKGLESALASHANFVQSWSSEISFRDLHKAKDVSETYVELNLYLTPRRTRLLIDKSFKPLEEVLASTNSNLIVLGNPGAGKTTSMKFICNKLLYDESFLNNVVSFPIVIRLRDLKVSQSYSSEKPEIYAESIFYHIYQLLGLQMEIKSANSSLIIQFDNYFAHIKLLQDLAISILDDLNVLLILDGLDETTERQQKQLVEEIRAISIRARNARVIVTCRTGEYNYSIEKTEVYEICELNDSQIKLFIKKWLKNPEAAEKVYEQISQSPFKDTLAKPLTLAHLCAIYERYGSIPDKPKILYRKIVQLLIEEWDSQRNISRESKYGNFTTDRKFDFLSHLAYYLTTDLQRITFSKTQFEGAYRAICENFGLPKNEAERVATQLESHTGLFLQTSYEDYEFAHKSIQEFLTADHLVKLPQIPFDRPLLYKIPNELSLAIAISSNPTQYFASLLLVNLRIEQSTNTDFAQVFLHRLSLEKPDFIVHPILGVAFLVFAERFSSNRLGASFMQLAQNVQIKLSVIRALEYYIFASREEKNGRVVLRFECLNNFENDVTSSIPQLICVDEDLLSSFS